MIWALRGRDPGRADERLFAWVARQMPTTLFASVVSIMEFQNGIRLLERRDKPAAAAIRRWTQTRLRPAFEGRLIAIDEAVAARCSSLGCADFRDAILAATALEHGLVLATPKPENFRGAKVKCINPWTDAEDSEDLDWRRASGSAPIWLRSLFLRA